MDYQQLLIKRFCHWDLYLHGNQHPYLGRCYAAATRKEAELVTDITPEETRELFSTIIPTWHDAVTKLFGASRPNMAFLGNTWRHLHAHLIPRFEGEKNFYGISFIDPNPQGNYSPYEKRTIPPETLLEIREDISNQLG